MNPPADASIRIPAAWIRPSIQKIHGYVPGEQPKVRGLIKLNTNENPYPPSPKVLEALRAAIGGKLRLYPNPTAEPLRQKLAVLHGCEPENIVIGNGSDELLALATRAFVDPLPSASASRAGQTATRATIQAFDPSYSLYPVLAEIHSARFQPVPLGDGFQLPSIGKLRHRTSRTTKGIGGHRVQSAGDSRTEMGPAWNFDAALSLITTPNAPTGRGYRTADLGELCAVQNGIVVLDEAYVDFSTEHAMRLALEHPNVLVARTFSKAYSLCSLRVGYMVGNPLLIGALHKIRDSYNVNGLGQTAALATLSDLAYYRDCFKRIIATREWTSHQLTLLGFRVFPSQTNFLLVHPPACSAEEWHQSLRKSRILVRWFSGKNVSQFLRITIGSEDEMERFIRAARRILKDWGRAFPE